MSELIAPIIGERFKALNGVRHSMAPPPIIRNAVLQVLTSAEGPLPFTEVQSRTCLALRRKRIDGKTIVEALTSLRDSQLVEKELVDGKSVWSLTSRYYISSLQTSFQRLITKGVSGDIGKILDNGAINMTTPYTVFLIPPQDEYNVADRSGMSVSVNWASPAGGIASTLFNDYLCLEDSIREGIGHLLMWAYWVGVRNYVDDFGRDIEPGMTLERKIREMKSFVREVIVDAEKRHDGPRVRGENAILKVLELTEELIAKDNLREFITFAAEKRATVQDLHRTILESFGHYMGTGEQLFNHLTMDLGERVTDGLNAVGRWEALQHHLPRHMLAALDVWNEFISILIGTVGSSDAVSNIRGTLDKSKESLEGYCHYITSLVDLMKKRKVGAIYLWGFPDIDTEAERQFKFSDFDSWRDDVKSGRADHRVWLFEEKTLNRVRRAYHSVKSGGQPLPQRIDKENWTLLDVYKYHPRGRDRKFWLEVLESLEARNAPENSQHMKEAVPEGVYSEFKKRERQAVTDMLDEEERRILHSADCQDKI